MKLLVPAMCCACLTSRSQAAGAHPAGPPAQHLSLPSYAGKFRISSPQPQTTLHQRCTPLFMAAGMGSAASLPVSLSVPNLVLSKVTSQAVMEGREAPESPASTQSPALGERRCLYHPGHRHRPCLTHDTRPSALLGAQHAGSHQCVCITPGGPQGLSMSVRPLPGLRACTGGCSGQHLHAPHSRGKALTVWGMLLLEYPKLQLRVASKLLAWSICHGPVPLPAETKF